jgi:WD40 repeat protein
MYTAPFPVRYLGNKYGASPPMYTILCKQDAAAFMEQWGFPSYFPKMQHYKLDTLPMDRADAAELRLPTNSDTKTLVQNFVRTANTVVQKSVRIPRQTNTAKQCLVSSLRTVIVNAAQHGQQGQTPTTGYKENMIPKDNNNITLDALHMEKLRHAKSKINRREIERAHSVAPHQVNQAPLMEGMQNTTEAIAESKVDCAKTSQRENHDRKKADDLKKKTVRLENYKRERSEKGRLRRQASLASLTRGIKKPLNIVAIVGGVATVVGGVVAAVVRDAAVAAAVVEGVAATVVGGVIGGHGNTVDGGGGVLGEGGNEVFGDRGDGAFGGRREALENKPQFPVQAQKIMNNRIFSPRVWDPFCLLKGGLSKAQEKSVNTHMRNATVNEYLRAETKGTRQAAKLRVQKNEARAKSKMTPEQGETDARPKKLDEIPPTKHHARESRISSPHIMDGVLQHDGFLDQIMEMVQTIVDTMGMNDWSKVTNLLLGQMPAEGHFTDETPPMKHQTCAPVISSPQFPMPEGHTRIIDGSTQEHETRDQIIKTVQIIADATGTNFWNNATNILLGQMLTEKRITIEEYIEKWAAANVPLQGNGRPKRTLQQDDSPPAWIEQEAGMTHSFERDCLFGAAVMAQQRSRHIPTQAVEHEKLAGAVKIQTQEHMLNLAKTKDNERIIPAIAPVHSSSLLGQVIEKLTAEDLRAYANSMNHTYENTTIPAGALDICVLAHMLQWDFQVYRQLEEPTSDGLFTHAICLDTRSGTKKTVKLLYHNNHYALLPEVLPQDFKINVTPLVWALKTRQDKTMENDLTMGGITKHSTSGPNKEEIQGHQIWRIIEKIDRTLLNISRVDNLQNDHWDTVLAVSAMEGMMGLLELRCVSTINRQWHANTILAMKLLRVLSFQASSPLTENRGAFPMSHILSVIQACGSYNTRKIDMSNREINNTKHQNFMRKIIRTIREKCPKIVTIDLTGCQDQNIIQTLSTLLWDVIRDLKDDIQPVGAPVRAVLLYNTLRAHDTLKPLREILQHIQDHCRIQVIVSLLFVPDDLALSLATENCPLDTALVLGTDWSTIDAVVPKTFNVNPSKYSRITGAIIRGCFETVEVLIRARGKVNHASKDGRTPIYIAAATQRMDMVVLLVQNGADIYASASDYTGLLSMAIVKTGNLDHSINIMKLAIDRMEPLNPSQAPLIVEFLKHRLLPDWQPQTTIQKLRLACQDPEFLGQWIASHDLNAKKLGVRLGKHHHNFGTDYVTGVLSALLTSDPTSNNVLLRAMRSLLYSHKRIWEAGGIKNLEEAGLTGNLMIQLAAQEGILWPKSETARQQCVITKRQGTDIKLDFVIHGVTASSLCCGGTDMKQQVLAWRQPEGIRIVDQRSGFERLMIYTSDEPLGHQRFDLEAPSIIAFGHINPQDNKLLASAEDERIVIYQWQKFENSGSGITPTKVTKGAVLKTIKEHTKDVTALSFSEDSSVLVSGSLDKKIMIWLNPYVKTRDSQMGTEETPHTSIPHEQEWQRKGTLTGHEQPVVTIAVSSDGSRVASGSIDGSIRLWDTTNFTCMHIILGQTQETMVSARRGVLSVALSPDGTRIAGVFQESQKIPGRIPPESDSDALLWLTPIRQDGDRSLVETALQGHTDLVTSACFLPLSREQVLTASRDCTVKFWNIEQKACLCTFRAHEKPILHAIFSSKHFLPQTISTYSMDKTVKTWQFTPLRNKEDPPVHTESVTLLQLAPSGQLLASAGGHAIFVWDMPTCRLCHTLVETQEDIREVQVLAFSTCGHRVAGGAGMRISIWNLLGPTSTDPTTTGYHTPIYAVCGPDIVMALAFSPDNLILTSCAYGQWAD